MDTLLRYLMVAIFGSVVLVALHLAFQGVAVKQLDQYSHKGIPFALIVCCIALVLHSQMKVIISISPYSSLPLFIAPEKAAAASSARLSGPIKRGLSNGIG